MDSSATVSDGPELTPNAKPFIQGNANQRSTPAMAYNGCSMTENNAMEKYLKDLQAEHAKLAGLVKIVELNHVLRLVELDMKNVCLSLKRQGFSESELPAPKGPLVTLSEKLMIPVDKYPEYNFVGRILGPRGMSVKQLEQETGCKINVKGRGSRKDSNGEKKAGAEQAENTATEEEKPYVLVFCQDTENRATLKLKRAIYELQRILNPTKPNGDELKRSQLTELAIINGTYRPPNFNILKNAQHIRQPLSAMQQQPFQGYQVQHTVPTASSYGRASSNAQRNFF